MKYEIQNDKKNEIQEMMSELNNSQNNDNIIKINEDYKISNYYQGNTLDALQSVVEKIIEY